ncbi:MAG: bifunctional (p)ppGpp synthetase/guanosine-3',5'-bis(diphosphate) 3'-pyrophosphohydrolase [Actinobacteria bacterium]|nr:bifunctional (p)ppGpp synthetase/guanosine-3',5'-bis(diphosphate) 3'-pyrophosphohydrolase [Actinomycetota bacterium]
MTDPTDEAMDRILSAYAAHHPNGDAEAIRRAYELGRRQHEGQIRQTGDPYITHPVAVTEILAGYGLDTETLCAALLHDTVEDTDLTVEEVREQFGEEVASLIDGVTKLDRIKFGSREEAQAATIRKMVIALARDVRVLLIKLADRLHNLRTIWPFPEEKQQRIARESLDVYAPLAHRLGVQEIKHEMEDRCFAILYPRRNAEIKALLKQRAPQRDAYLGVVIGEVKQLMEDAHIEGEVTGRPKHEYSIYRKMVNSGLPFERIHDLIGIRVIVDDVRGCYAVLGLVHATWPPVHGRFKDYVAMPKFNLYQSLHTTVIGPGGGPLEVQIRTREMHERAEFGIAAHWRYKEGRSADTLPWMADLRFLQDEYEDPNEFLAGLKLDLYQDEVFVLTPKGDVKTLPKGATPVDFAYRVHTEVGHRCIGAKVNGRLVPLDTKLESGDIVEIVTSKAQDAGPSRDWLAFVRTSRARAKIRQWFGKERRGAALTDGREAVLSLLRKEGLGLHAKRRDELLASVAERLGQRDIESLFVAVGEGTVSGSTVVARLLRLARPEEEEAVELAVPEPPPVRPRPDTGVGVIVEGLDDVWVRIARCCAPLPGDDIVGFVTVGRGVSVHRSDCTNIASLGKERMIDVSWAPERVGRFSVWIQIEALDRPRLLRDVTERISDIGGDIRASSSTTSKDRTAVLRYEVELSDPGQVDRLIDALRGIEGVYDAYRLVPRAGLDG